MFQPPTSSHHDITFGDIISIHLLVISVISVCDKYVTSLNNVLVPLLISYLWLNLKNEERSSALSQYIGTYTYIFQSLMLFLSNAYTLSSLSRVPL